MKFPKTQECVDCGSPWVYYPACDIDKWREALRKEAAFVLSDKPEWKDLRDFVEEMLEEWL